MGESHILWFFGTHAIHNHTLLKKTHIFEKMNEYQTQLFNDLQKLCDSHDRKKRIFFYKDHTFKNKTFRIFNYQLANYAQFCLPNALECRGHMFEIDKNEKPIRLASLPVPKFFNIGENPFTQNLDFDGARQIMRKEDGSLMSTLNIDGELFLKSKASLTSGQAVDGLEFLNLPENLSFKNELLKLENEGFTVNLEWTSPSNRIVLFYDTSALVVLNIRSKENGEYLEKEHLDSEKYPEMIKRWVEVIETDDPAAYIEKSYDEKEIEGYVVQLKSGQFCKAKTKWYLSLHRTRDNLEGQKLFNCVLEESTDDLKSLYSLDEKILKHIELFEEQVLEILNDIQYRVERFWKDELDSIKFIEKSQSRKIWELACLEFENTSERNLCMKFLKRGGEFTDKDWKEFVKSGWKYYKDSFAEGILIVED